MKQLLYILGCSALLASCGTFKTYERPEGLTDSLGIDNLYRNAAGPVVANPIVTEDFGNMPWEKVFTDPDLQSLIRKALASNTNMQIAESDVQKALAGLKVARLAYYPQIGFNPQGSMSSWDFNKATKTYSLPVAASWQFNLPALRNQKKKAGVTVDLTKAAKQATRTAIIANVANLYYTLQMLDEQLKTTQATVELWAENVRAMELMKEGAMTTEAAVGQAKANYLNLLASVPTLKDNISQVENVLCAILQEPPHAIKRGAFNADAFPKHFSTGVPVDLLRNRPDIRAAELQLASAFYDVNIAKSAFYPSLNISLQGSWTNSAGSMIVNPGKILAAGLASLAQPIFANGQLKAQLKIAKLEYEDMVNLFTQSVIDAGAEVSDALTSYYHADRKLPLMKEQVSTLHNTVDQTKQLFQLGTGTSYLNILTAQQSLIQAQLNLISGKFDKVQAAINLYQALGGGRETEEVNEQQKP